MLGRFSTRSYTIENGLRARMFQQSRAAKDARIHDLAQMRRRRVGRPYRPFCFALSKNPRMREPRHAR